MAPSSDYHPQAMTEIPPEYHGWWGIVDTETWVNDGLDTLGPALLSLTGSDDRLRMHCLLAYVNVRPTETGVSFSWKGAWEYDSGGRNSATATPSLRYDLPGALPQIQDNMLTTEDSV